MKKLFIIVCNDDKEMEFASEKSESLFKEIDASKEYLGFWGKIQFNKEECLNAISNTVNHFIELPDKKEIYFGCNSQNVSEIKALLLLDKCEVLEIPYSDFIK